MILEFTGATGAGKTLLAAQVRRRLQQRGIRVVNARDLLLGRPMPNVFGREGVQNVFIELALSAVIIPALARYREFLAFSWRAARSYTDSRYLALKALRGVWRQIGFYELAGQAKPPTIVLSDEGTVHAAHYLFVQLSSIVSGDYLESFVRLVPMPDLVVCVETPQDTLLVRIRERSDPPRRTLNRLDSELLVETAASVFARLKRIPRLTYRLLVVDGDDGTAADLGRRRMGLSNGAPQAVRA
jgi:broad-specificity NMP kinase